MGQFESTVRRSSGLLTGRGNDVPPTAPGATSGWTIQKQRHPNGFLSTHLASPRHNSLFSSINTSPAITFGRFSLSTHSQLTLNSLSTPILITRTHIPAIHDTEAMTKDLYTTPASRWRALQTRDPLSATSFIYAVKSTGIYCRPTCPARLARRANILFFDHPSQASSAGFRPCRRCAPEDAWAPSTRGRHEELVWRACAEMEAKGGDVNLRSLARGVGLSARYFHGVFKRVVGVTPGVYAEGLRAGVEGRTEEESGWEVGGGWLPTEEEMLQALGERIPDILRGLLLLTDQSVPGQCNRIGFSR